MSNAGIVPGRAVWVRAILTDDEMEPKFGIKLYSGFGTMEVGFPGYVVSVDHDRGTALVCHTAFGQVKFANVRRDDLEVRTA